MKAALLACVASALAGTVSLDIQKDLCTNGSIGKGNALYRDIHRKNSKAPDTVSDQLADAFFSYFATLYIGSDKQKVIPSIDTGSSDLWVMTDTNPYCKGEDASECIGMVFDPSTSTTFKNTTEPWDISYLDTTGAFGFLCEDTVEVGGAAVHNQKMGVADVANSTQDVLGVGYQNGEAMGKYNFTSKEFVNIYPNYPTSLKDQGFINTIAYSLYLNSLVAQDGVVLFGGVDHAKYSGTLGLVPVVNVYYPIIDIPITFDVMLSGISVTSGGSSCPLVTGFNYPVLLDSGTSFAILPNSTVSALADAYMYTWNETTGWFEGSCTVFDFDSFTFSFSGVNVDFPADTLIAPGFGDGQCLLAIQTDDDPVNFILGDVFLRSLYVVYDLEHNQIAIGQAKYTDESDVEEILSTVPRATSAPHYSHTQYTLTATSHNASMCQTKTTTAATHPWYTNDDFQSTLYYGTSTPSSSTGASAPTNSTDLSIISATSSGPKTRGYFNGSTSASATPSGSASSSSSSGTAITTTVPTPTTFSTLGSTFTVSESTVLTITDCGCTETPASTSGVSSEAPSEAAVEASETPSASHTHGPIAVSFAASTTTTEVVSTLVTSCSGPTTISTNGATYTVTDSTVLTITDCPCTLTHTIGRSTPAIASSAVATPASESAVASAPSTPASESAVASAPSTPASESAVASAPSTPASESAVAFAPSSAGTACESTASSIPSSSESAPVVASGTTSTTPALANAAIKNTFGAGILLALGLTLV